MKMLIEEKEEKRKKPKEEKEPILCPHCGANLREERISVEVRTIKLAMYKVKPDEKKPGWFFVGEEEEDPVSEDYFCPVCLKELDKVVYRGELRDVRDFV